MDRFVAPWSHKQISDCLDKAFEHLFAGEFVSAAVYFQQVIDESGNPDARYIAKRDLEWWCLPLESLVTQLKDTGRAWSLNELITECLGPDTTADYRQHVVSSLHKIATVCCLGDQLWIHRSCLKTAIRLIIIRFREHDSPTTLSDMARRLLMELDCPDVQTSEQVVDSLRTELDNADGIVVTTDGCVFDQTSLQSFQSVLLELLKKRKKPVRLREVVDSMSWPSSVKAAVQIRSLRIWLHSQRDRGDKASELGGGWWFASELLDLTDVPPEEVFEDRFDILDTETIVLRFLFGDSHQEAPSVESLLQSASRQLARNPSLTRLRDERWILTATVKHLVDLLVDQLAVAGKPISIGELMQCMLPSTRKHQFIPEALRSSLILRLERQTQVLRMTKEWWVHRAAMKATVDQIYGVLQNTEARTTFGLLTGGLGISCRPREWRAAFFEEFETALRNDDRFTYDPANCLWYAVSHSALSIQLAHDILWAEKTPLRHKVLVERVQQRLFVPLTDLDLAGDDRFRRWDSDSWGLSQWTDINDQALEYLGLRDEPLDRDSLVSAVCERHGIDPDLAIFTPEEDPRFGQRSDGKWFCLYNVTDADMEKMLGFLCSAECGYTLDDLVFWNIGVDAHATDASACLGRDNRFVLVEGLWFARQIFHPLTDREVDRLLAILEEEGSGLRLAPLVERALGQKAELTDAEARLTADPRFTELLPGVWAASWLAIQSVERTPVFNVAIPSETGTVVPDEDLSVLESLTLREAADPSEPGAIQTSQMKRTLSLLDIRHGNLVIDRALSALVDPDVFKAVHFTDDEHTEFTCWVDREKSLLQGLGRWFEARQLTFGDRVLLRPTFEPGFLEIQPLGERDERVHKEAIQRQDIEQLIEAARQSNMSYHDIMVEVMDRLNQQAGKNVPVRREVIFDLVSHRRTASRSYIFGLLSLSDCPYEELRYFVKHGGGYWSFDPERKRAFDMKMKQLVTSVEQLEVENAELRARLSSGWAGDGSNAEQIRDLKQKLRAQEKRSDELASEHTKLLRANRDLRETGESQLREIEELEVKVAVLEASQAELTARIEQCRREDESLKGDRHEMQRALEEQAQQTEQLLAEKAALETEASELKTRAEDAAVSSAALELTVEKLQTQLESLKAESASLHEHYEQVTAELTSRTEELKTANERLQTESEDAQKRRKEEQGYWERQMEELGSLRHYLATLEDESAFLQSEMARLRPQNVELHAEVSRLEDQLGARDEECIGLRREHEEALATLESKSAAKVEEYQSLVRQAERQQVELQRELNSERERVDELRLRLAELQRLQEMGGEESAWSTADLERVRAAMRTVPGRIFIRISQLMGGPDLSDL